MWLHHLNPTLIKLGGLEIRYYGLVYVLGFFLAVAWLFYLKKKGKLILNKDDIWDFVFYLMLGVLVGSRLFMVFWEPAYYFFDPLNLLKIWQGGMSFHGGLVGIVLAGYLYCRKKSLDWLQMADFLAVPLILALALGRIANFINGELVGKIWSGKWCVVFPDYQGCRHPYVLYEAGKRFLLFGWLLWLSLRKEFKPGFIFWNLVFWEGLGRFLLDFYREDILYFSLSLGQWFSLVMVLTTLFVFLKSYQKDWKSLFKKKQT